jgi:hypothetical protein
MTTHFEEEKLTKEELELLKEFKEIYMKNHIKMPKIQKIKHKREEKIHYSYLISIPSSIIKLKGLDKGDKVEFLFSSC